MSAGRKLVTRGAVFGAAATMSGADAFVAPNAAGLQRRAPAALRGTTEVLAQMTSAQRDDSSAAALGGAAGLAVAGSLAVGTVTRGRASRARRASNIARNFNKEQQIGAQAPLGFWDPLDFCKDEASFRDYRAKELKHGRLAMMGALGMLVQSVVQVPGMEGVPKGVTAITSGNGLVGGAAVFALIGVLEAGVFVQDESKEPGNFGNPLPWFDDYSEEMRARELNNGRIAMFSAIGIIAASLYTGKSAIEQFGL